MIRSLFLSLFLLCLSIGALAQAWSPCNIAANSNNTFGTDVCVHNGKLYAVTGSTGLMVSTDNGESWTTVNEDLSSPSVALFSTGDRLYAVLTNSGCSYIQYSEDDGETFVVDSEGLPTCYDGAVTQPSAGGISWQNHLMFSLAGPDWEFSRNTTEDTWVDASYFDENDCSEFFVKNDTCWAGMNGATSNGVAWSIDGINWTSPASIGILEFFVPAQVAWINNRLIVMGGPGYDTAIKYSDDYGESFEEMSITEYLDPYAFFSISGLQPTLNIYSGNGALYLALGNDVLESAPELIVSYDQGQTFEKDTLGFPTGVLGTNFSIRNMAFLDGWAFAILNSGDLYKKQIAPVSIGESSFLKAKLNVFPNPMTDQICIQTDHSFGIQDFEILDVSGRVVIRGKLAGDSTVLDVEGLRQGMYFLRVLQTGEMIKLVKK